ncbi:hypothetical protein HAP48_0042620 [Bradyrhizobium septentrionale]|uniref:Uncharacterized protein n=1 Tax=Bradyrhizobium septentrionale TaxID=1404411 RepID=A0A973W3D9_9BRAD|nr:hypothetical protein [Bradyrhizobium septentrionale]UGY15154.1 hypothetical protein HAP48_0042620 [Bradyrhizobium septentrionale]
MKDTQPVAVRFATGAFCQSLLDSMLPTIRTVARDRGYAVAVHGSLARDIDLIAVAWTEEASSHGDLVMAICEALSADGLLGRCHILGKASSDENFGRKPHGRVAYTLVHGGFIGEIDLSVIPPRSKPALQEL